MANKFSDFLAQFQPQEENQIPYPMMAPQDVAATPMPAEQSDMLSQMGAQQRLPASPQITSQSIKFPVQMPPTAQSMQHQQDMGAFKSKFDDYSNQYADQLKKLQGFQQAYQQQPQGIDYRPIAAFLGGLPQNKNAQLLEAANAIAPESLAKRQQNAIAQQQQMVKDTGDMAKNADYVKMLNGQMNAQNAMLRQATADQRNNLMGQRITLQEEKEARASMNNDAMLKQYGPRLEGAAKIGELINAAHEGKVVSNQALLGQLNAEISRLETGSQSPGLHASEKTELNSYKAQLGALRDSITGDPQDAVQPQILNTADKMVKELSSSYMKGMDSRIDYIKGGMRPNQTAIADEKHKSLINTYAPRFGGWQGLKEIKLYQGKTYEKQGDQWVEVP